MKFKNWILNLELFSTIVATSSTIIACDEEDIENIKAINNKITIEANKKTMPKIKGSSKNKAINNVKIEDIEITSSDSTLTSKIKGVKLPTTPDGTMVVATIEVASSVSGTNPLTYEVKLSGFAFSIGYINNKITIEATKKTSPRIKSGLETKTARDVQIEDIEITSFDLTLTSTVKGVKLPTAPDGTTIVATIEVASSVSGTTPLTYEVKLIGFVSLVNFLNIKIMMEFNAKRPPTMKKGRAYLTATQIKTPDIVPPTRYSFLYYNISKVIPSTKTPDGTTVTVTIAISAKNNLGGTFSRSYITELGGFTKKPKL